MNTDTKKYSPPLAVCVRGGSVQPAGPTACPTGRERGMGVGRDGGCGIATRRAGRVRCSWLLAHPRNKRIETQRPGDTHRWQYAMGTPVTAFIVIPLSTTGWEEQRRRELAHREAVRFPLVIHRHLQVQGLGGNWWGSYGVPSFPYRAVKGNHGSRRANQMRRVTSAHSPEELHPPPSTMRNSHSDP